MKFFLHISEKEQEKRMEVLEKKADTSWRISKRDVWQHKHYKKCQEAYLSFMKDTSLSSAPWYMIDAESRKWTKMETIKLRTEYIKLGQALKAAGLVESGVDAKEKIVGGEVQVNGAVELQRGKKLYDGDVVSFHGEEIRIEK